MKKNTLESLPNELLLIIFGYLSSFDLCRAFLEVKNARIQRLLTSIHHSLDVSSMHYDQLRQFLSNNNDFTNRFTALIDTVVLRDSSACGILLGHWKKTLHDTELFNKWLPSIKRLLILNPDYYEYGLVQSLLIPLVFRNNTLQHLHLVFERPTSTYSSILFQLILHRISVHTMILEVEKGHEFHPDNFIKNDFHKMKSLCWPNTVQLTLSIQHPSELIFFLERDALPMIEHLYITNEEVRTASSFHRNKSISNIQLCDHDLRQIAADIRLRSLVIRYLSLGDLIIFIGLLNMSLLEKLTLVDVYDHTLDHVGKFKELCCSTYFPVLKHLHFSFCFPKELEEAWQISSFGRNNEWPFDNIGCYIDEVWIHGDDKYQYVTKPLFIVYKRPINILLQHKRTLHNHRFATHACAAVKTAQKRSVEWTFDQIDEPDQIVKTLQVIASNRVNKLYLTNLVEQTSISMTSSGTLFLHHLRSLTFDFDLYLMESSQRVSIIKKILDASPNLSHLVVAWKDFRHCSKTYSNLKHVRLLLERFHPEPKQHVNVRRLTQLAPHLCQLETSHANMMFNKNLVLFVLKIIRQLHQLVYLILNKDSLYQSKEEKKIMFRERLIAAGNGQLFDCNNIRIGFPRCDELCIWL